MNMKKYKGIVFFDYDGTTVDEVDKIKTATPKTRESLQKLKENGYLTMLCSGRTKKFLENDIDAYQGAITCNGCYTEIDGEIIRNKFIPDELLFRIIDEYFHRDVIIQMDTQQVTYYLHQDAEFFREFRELFNLPEEWYAPWKFRKKDNRINKLILNYKDPQVYRDFKAEFKDTLEIAKHIREPYLDITLKGITKGNAVRELIEKLGIDRKDTYAFGDMDNDIEMMKEVGTGIAMGRHTEGVAEVASMITGTVKEEGITTALEKLGLI
ncbi:MAG: HAD family hydrolase [Lachnospiraceae bacterium]|nr:HAD family hydrolase [Lachnospiraceae bacterium]